MGQIRNQIMNAVIKKFKRHLGCWVFCLLIGIGTVTLCSCKSGSDVRVSSGLAIGGTTAYKLLLPIDRMGENETGISVSWPKYLRESRQLELNNVSFGEAIRKIESEYRIDINIPERYSFQGPRFEMSWFSLFPRRPSLEKQLIFLISLMQERGQPRLDTEQVDGGDGKPERYFSVATITDRTVLVERLGIQKSVEGEDENRGEKGSRFYSKGKDAEDSKGQSRQKYPKRLQKKIGSGLASFDVPRDELLERIQIAEVLQLLEVATGVKIAWETDNDESYWLQQRVSLRPDMMLGEALDRVSHKAGKQIAWEIRDDVVWFFAVREQRSLLRKKKTSNLDMYRGLVVYLDEREAIRCLFPCNLPGYCRPYAPFSGPSYLDEELNASFHNVSIEKCLRRLSDCLGVEVSLVSELEKQKQLLEERIDLGRGAFVASWWLEQFLHQLNASKMGKAWGKETSGGRCLFVGVAKPREITIVPVKLHKTQ